MIGIRAKPLLIIVALSALVMCMAATGEETADDQEQGADEPIEEERYTPAKDPEDEQLVFLDLERERIRRETDALNSLRKDVQQDIEELRQLQQQVETRLNELDRKQDERFSELAGIYNKMDSVEVTRILAEMDQPTSIEVLSRMKPASVAEILAAMEPEKAARWSKKLIDRQSK